MNKNYTVLKEEITASPKNRKHQLIDATIQTPDGKEVAWQYIKTRDVVTIVAIYLNLLRDSFRGISGSISGSDLELINGMVLLGTMQFLSKRL